MCTSLRKISQFALFTGLGLVLAACGGGGGSSGSPSGPDIRYESSTSPVKEISSQCVGAECSVTGGTTYRAPASVVWAYRNTSDKPMEVDVSFADLKRGQEITYVFSSGPIDDGFYFPYLGSAAGAAGVTSVAQGRTPQASVFDPVLDAYDRGHGKHLAGAAFPAFTKPSSSATSAAAADTPSTGARASVLSVALSEPQDWFDTESEKTVSASVQFSCFAGRRRVVTWAVTAISRATRNAIEQTMCGDSGAVMRMKELLGDVWGPNTPANTIQETAANPLDINIVILDSIGVPWSGYFSKGNAYLKSAYAPSNAALAFFMSAESIAKNLASAQSILIHELTHMVYFYQRDVLHGYRSHDVWLKEMTAMMSEDIIGPYVIQEASGRPYNKVVNYRLQTYLNSGGGLNLQRWPLVESSGPHYGMAGGFGAYLNRQYGLGLYKYLLTQENSGTKPCGTSWECLDAAVKYHGGKSAEEDFYQFGATVFSLASANAPSAKFSFPAKTSFNYRLAAVDLSTYAPYRKPQAGELADDFWPATTHTYMVESVNASIFAYKRRALKVPPRSYLTVTVR